MPGTIHMIARQYVDENAAKYNGQPEQEAVAALNADLRQHVENEGWNADDYLVDLEEIARDGLRRHRKG